LENQKLYERIDDMRNDERALQEQVMIIIHRAFSWRTGTFFPSK